MAHFRRRSGFFEAGQLLSSQIQMVNAKMHQPCEKAPNATMKRRERRVKIMSVGEILYCLRVYLWIFGK